jgi:2'-5' RNA ligase
MPYSVELFFDPVTSDAIQAMWKGLASVTGSDYMVKNGVYPHVALTVMESNCPELEKFVSEIALKTQPISMEPTKIDSFHASPDVVFLGMKKDEKLMKLHADVYGVVERYGLKCQEYYTPEKWIPHCTLAMEFDPKFTSAAIKKAASELINLHLFATSIGIVSFPPTKRLSNWELKG